MALPTILHDKARVLIYDIPPNAEDVMRKKAVDFFSFSGDDECEAGPENKR